MATKTTQCDDLGEQTQLAADVAALREEIAELRKQLSTEVRTRRLVVVDGSGREAIYTETAARYTNLTVCHPMEPVRGDRDTLVEPAVVLLQADSENGTGQAAVTVTVDERGAGSLCAGATERAKDTAGITHQMFASSVTLHRDGQWRRSGEVWESQTDREPYLEASADGVRLRSSYDHVVAEAPMQLVVSPTFTTPSSGPGSAPKVTA